MIYALSDVQRDRADQVSKFLTSGVVSKPTQMPGDQRFRCPGHARVSLTGIRVESRSAKSGVLEAEAVVERENPNAPAWIPLSRTAESQPWGLPPRLKSRWNQKV